MEEALRYEIIFAPEAEEDLLPLRATDRATVLDAIETHLRYSRRRSARAESSAWTIWLGRNTGYALVTFAHFTM